MVCISFTYYATIPLLFMHLKCIDNLEYDKLGMSPANSCKLGKWEVIIHVALFLGSTQHFSFAQCLQMTKAGVEAGNEASLYTSLSCVLSTKLLGDCIRLI